MTSPLSTHRVHEQAGEVPGAPEPPHQALLPRQRGAAGHRHIPAAAHKQR